MPQVLINKDTGRWGKIHDSKFGYDKRVLPLSPENYWMATLIADEVTIETLNHIRGIEGYELKQLKVE